MQLDWNYSMILIVLTSGWTENFASVYGQSPIKSQLNEQCKQINVIKIKTTWVKWHCSKWNIKIRKVGLLIPNSWIKRSPSVTNTLALTQCKFINFQSSRLLPSLTNQLLWVLILIPMVTTNDDNGETRLFVTMKPRLRLTMTVRRAAPSVASIDFRCWL